MFNTKIVRDRSWSIAIDVDRERSHTTVIDASHRKRFDAKHRIDSMRCFASHRIFQCDAKHRIEKFNAKHWKSVLKILKQLKIFTKFQKNKSSKHTRSVCFEKIFCWNFVKILSFKKVFSIEISNVLRFLKFSKTSKPKHFSKFWAKIIFQNSREARVLKNYFCEKFWKMFRIWKF